MITQEWRKSSRSSGNSDCVEVRETEGGMIETRHSQNPDGPTIAYTKSEWDAFLKGAKAGEFDL